MFRFSIDGNISVLEKEMEREKLHYEVWFSKIKKRYCMEDIMAATDLGKFELTAGIQLTSRLPLLSMRQQPPSGLHDDTQTHHTR